MDRPSEKESNAWSRRRTWEFWEKIIDIKEPKLEKEVEQKSFKKGRGEGGLQAGFHSALWRGCIPCKYTELIAFPHHLCGHKCTL